MWICKYINTNTFLKYRAEESIYNIFVYSYEIFLQFDCLTYFLQVKETKDELFGDVKISDTS